jgi:uncharacterized membrane protein YfcA
MKAVLNALVGFFVGTAGGLIGLGGAELRLPYLAGVLKLTAHQAVPINLAVSLFTLVGALPVRLYTLRTVDLWNFVPETIAIALGAVFAAWVGASWLRRLSAVALSRTIFALLLMLGFAMIAESSLELASKGLLPSTVPIRIAAGLLSGLLIGAISSVLGVAGGEVIIPTLVFGYGIPVKAAGSLSMFISLPTVLAGIIRHARHGAFANRAVALEIILPMSIGAIGGASVGGLLVGIAPAAVIKMGLGILLICSAWKVFAGREGKAAGK